MRRLRVLLALWPVLALLSLLTLAACTPGDEGSEEIAFVRNGQIWTIDPDGANAFTVVAQGTPIAGYGLSPDHHMLVFRTLDTIFAQSAAGKHLAANPLTGLMADAPGTLSALGIDGGTPIPLIDSGSNISESNAWWSPAGTRLLYREGSNPPAWWISQDDQPMGIARKALPPSFSIPSINAPGSMAIGNSEQGIFSTTLAGTDLTAIQAGILAGHPLPASLERVLWQPAHAQPALLYAVALRPMQGTAAEYALMLRDARGQTRSLIQCTCQQFAWSPDGSMVLYSTSQGYSLIHIQDGSQRQFTAEPGAMPYWSPDSQQLLLDGLHMLTLIQVATGQTHLLLSDGQPFSASPEPLPSSQARLQPLANNLWNADSQRFVLVTRGRLQWQGQTLKSGDGLYTFALNPQGQVTAAPRLVDQNARDRLPGWSYLDPNTSFLFAS